MVRHRPRSFRRTIVGVVDCNFEHDFPNGASHRWTSQQWHASETRLGLAASELLLVGDDVQNDIEAARAAGWQGVLSNAR